jgi:hypothetical protein
MGLKLADTKATQRFVRGEDTDWIDGNEKLGIEAHPADAGDDAWVEVRTVLTKAEDAAIDDVTTAERLIDEGRMSLKPARRATADPLIFDMLVTGWSLDGKPSRAAYERLDAGDAAWLDSCIRRAVDTARKTIEGNSESPGTASSQTESPTHEDPDQPKS